MSFFLYHVSVFISGDWVSQQFPDWSRQAGHTRSTAPPILGITPWSARFSCGCWGIWILVLIFAQRAFLPSEPFLQPQVQNSLFDSLCFFYFYYCPQTTLRFAYFYYSRGELFLRGKEQMYFRGVMLIVTKIVMNCSAAFYNKQEQSYIFEIRNHLLPFEVENSVVWYINKIKK